MDISTFVEILQGVHLNVPFGHAFGEEVPTEQKKPGGHGKPVTLSSGEDSEAPPTQTNPAAHGPLAKVLPLNKYHSTKALITSTTEQPLTVSGTLL